ncbi:MAG: hypothetical protein ABI600_00695 [Luteolibacter sp.]
MAASKTTIAPLSEPWLAAVIPILERGDPASILWTGRAQREMAAAGLEFKWNAYELCLQVLRTPGMLGEQIHGMIDERDNTLCETWAFLCPHPLLLKIPLYVKIALHGSQVHLVMISMHTDHSGKLLQAIRAFLKKKP